MMRGCSAARRRCLFEVDKKMSIRGNEVASKTNKQEKRRVLNQGTSVSQQQVASREHTCGADLMYVPPVPASSPFSDATYRAKHPQTQSGLFRHYLRIAAHSIALVGCRDSSIEPSRPGFRPTVRKRCVSLDLLHGVCRRFARGR